MDWNRVEGEGIEFREGWISPLWYKTVRFKVLSKIGAKIFQHGPGTAKGLRVSGADRMMVAEGGIRWWTALLTVQGVRGSS